MDDFLWGTHIFKFTKLSENSMTWGKFGLKDLEYLGYFLYTLANLLKK